MKKIIIIFALTLIVCASVETDSIAAATSQEPREYSQFEELPENVQREVAKNLSDKDLLQLAATSKRENRVLQEEMQSRPALYWRQQIKTIDLGNHKDAVNAITFSHDGTRLVSGSGDTMYPYNSKDNSIIIWDTRTTKELIKLTSPKPVTSIAISPDNKKIASNCTDRTVRLWNSTAEGQIREFSGRDRRLVTFSHNGEQLAFIAYGPKVTIINVETFKEKSQLIRDDIYQIAFSPNDTVLAGFTNGNRAETFLWNLETDEIKRIRVEGLLNLSKPYAIEFSPDIKLCALGGKGRFSLSLWNVETGALFGNLKAPAWDPMTGIFSLAFSHDGKLLASGGNERTISIWNVSTQKEIAQIPTKTTTLALAFSPDDKTLAAGFADGSIKLYKAGK